MTDTLRIFDKNFAETGVCVSFISLEYTEEFRGAGDAELVVRYDSPTAKLLEPDGFISPPGAGFYIIKSVVRDLKNGTVRAECAGLLSLFSRKVFPEEYMYSGSANTLLRSMARQGEEFLPAGLSVTGADSGKAVTFFSGRSTLYDDMTSMCRIGGIGMGLEYDGEKLVFAAKNTRNRTAGGENPAPEADRLGAFFAESVVSDFSGYGNVAVVSGAEKNWGGRYTLTIRADESELGDDFDDGAYTDRQILVRFNQPLSIYYTMSADGQMTFNETMYQNSMRAAGISALISCRPKFYLYGRGDSDASLVRPGDLISVDGRPYFKSGTALAEKVVTSYKDGCRKVYCELCAAML